MKQECVFGRYGRFASVLVECSHGYFITISLNLIICASPLITGWPPWSPSHYTNPIPGMLGRLNPPSWLHSLNVPSRLWWQCLLVYGDTFQDSQLIFRKKHRLTFTNFYYSQICKATGKAQSQMLIKSLLFLQVTEYAIILLEQCHFRNPRQTPRS